MTGPFISICIPAYKRIEFLKRLLESIVIQSFRDFEVIITDDSNDGSVSSLVVTYEQNFKLHYIRNEVPLGTPENWNQAIRMASGQWIKLMHDDDWFSNGESLQKFADAAKQNPDNEFIFSAYCNVFVGIGTSEKVFVDSFRLKALLNNPVTLFSSNIVGPPSVTMHKNNQKLWYDKKIKWVVDIDFYIRFLKTVKPLYIPEVLINVGINEEQVTQQSFRIATVEIPENFYLLNKVGSHELKNILVYDAWWRLMRNLKMRNVEAIREAGYDDKMPPTVQSMIQWQKHIPQGLLQTGFVSKLFMILNYVRNLYRI